MVVAFVPLTHPERRELRLPPGVGLLIGGVASGMLWIGLFRLVAGT
jgi:hypothetical protein